MNDEKKMENIVSEEELNQVTGGADIGYALYNEAGSNLVNAAGDKLKNTLVGADASYYGGEESQPLHK